MKISRIISRSEQTWRYFSRRLERDTMYREEDDTEQEHRFYTSILIFKLRFYSISFSALDGRERILFGMIKVKIKAIIYFL